MAIIPHTIQILDGKCYSTTIYDSWMFSPESWKLSRTSIQASNMERIFARNNLIRHCVYSLTCTNTHIHTHNSHTHTYIHTAIFLNSSYTVAAAALSIVAAYRVGRRIFCAASRIDTANQTCRDIAWLKVRQQQGHRRATRDVNVHFYVMMKKVREHESYFKLTHCTQHN